MSTVEQTGHVKPGWKERAQLPVYFAFIGGLAATAVNAPGLIRFWPFSAAEFVQLVTPLFMISLFIERTLEVFVTSWRGPEAAIRERKINALRKQVKDRCKARMQRIAFAGSVAMGMIISAVGVRALGLFIDPAAFSALSEMQQASFNVVDVLLTGAMLGGGSDALHKFVTIFTNFMERTAKLAKGNGE
jgi:hypothetical protein